MKNRTQRMLLIKKIISEEVISSQDDLQIRLHELGCEVTQATLSRDLKAIHVTKVSDDLGGYVYRLSSADQGNTPQAMVALQREYMAGEGIGRSDVIQVLKSIMPKLESKI
ncbi:MAG: hypothetical protein NTV75_02360 [Bacteroidia bacterium]|nr:hypothetical protein [Bacteroidia bacterium]